jgi:hypothetical protein
MAINQISTANTFSEWVTTTSYLVAVANTLTDGINATPLITNTNMVFNGDQARLNVNNSADVNQLYSNTANVVNMSISNKTFLNDLSVSGSFTGAPNTAIYNTISAAIDSSIAFSIALG